MTADEVRAIIEAAWADAAPPAPGTRLCDTYMDEGVGAYFAGKTWRGHDVASLRWHSVGLSFFNAPAFQYYLPAYLLAVLEDASAADVICGSVPFSLSPRNLQRSWADSYRKRIAGFTAAQRAAIAAYLRWQQETLHLDADGVAETIAYVVDGVEPAAGTGADRLLTLAGDDRERVERMRTLSLSCSKVTDDDLAAIAELPPITELDLWSTAITDAGLFWVAAGCPQLATLDVSSCKLTHVGTGHLAQIGTLRELKASNCDLDDGALAALGPLRLERMNLVNNRALTAAGFAGLDVTELRRLEMYGVDAPDELCARLGAAGRIERIEVAAMTDAGVAALARASSLTFVKISSAEALSAAAMAALAALPALTDLELSGLSSPLVPGFPVLAKVSLLSSQTYGPLPVLPALRELRCYSDELPVHVGSIAKQPVLRELILHSRALADEHLDDLAGAEAIERLVLAAGPVTGRGLATIATLPALAKLELSGLPRLADKHLAVLARAPALTELTLESVPVSAAALAPLAGSATLARLVLSGTDIADADLASLRAARPPLEIVIR